MFVNLDINKFLSYWLPVLVWAGVIFYLSGVPNLNSGMAVFWDVFLRKLAHSGFFGILNLLLWRALYYGEKIEFKKALFWSFVLTILYAIFDEYHQSLIPMRQGKWQDAAQDSLGVLLTSAMLYAIFKFNGLRRMRSN